MKVNELGKFQVPEDGPIEVNAIAVSIDETTGLASEIKRIRKILK
jgi:calcineurin-like phosphoesterase